MKDIKDCLNRGSTRGSFIDLPNPVFMTKEDVLKPVETLIRYV